MKRRLCCLVALWAVALPLHPLAYRFQYLIQGQAASRVLIFIPFRIYYEASASVDFSAEPLPDGNLRLTSLSLPRSAYLLRTLGFSGRGAILVTADTDPARSQQFAAEKAASWRRLVPDFSKRAKTVRIVPRRLLVSERGMLRFERSSSGLHRAIGVDVRTGPIDPAGWHGYYFNIFQMMAESLNFYGHSFLPEGAAAIGSNSQSWESAPIDLTEVVNHIAGLIEKALSDNVTVKQAQPFRITYRLSRETPEEWLIEGVAAPRISLWKNFRIREFHRTVRILKKSGLAASDEIFLDVRNDKGHGGYAKMEWVQIE